MFWLGFVYPRSHSGRIGPIGPIQTYRVACLTVFCYLLCYFPAICMQVQKKQSKRWKKNFLNAEFMFDNEVCAYVKVSSLKITIKLQYMHGTWLSLSSGKLAFFGRTMSFSFYKRAVVNVNIIVLMSELTGPSAGVVIIHILGGKNKFSTFIIRKN